MRHPSIPTSPPHDSTGPAPQRAASRQHGPAEPARSLPASHAPRRIQRYRRRSVPAKIRRALACVQAKTDAPYAHLYRIDGRLMACTIVHSKAHGGPVFLSIAGAEERQSWPPTTFHAAESAGRIQPADPHRLRAV
jgi:hypothetical protein